MMNKTSLIILLAAALALSACHSSKTAIAPQEGMSRELQAAGLNVEQLSAKSKDKFLKDLAGTYTPWESMALDGNVQIKSLPLDPSVKVYMERGKLLLLSLRVPLLGEVGRVEIDNDSALIVNRRGKCFTKVATAKMLNRIGVNLTDFQDLLLGRVFMAGSASLSKDNVELFSVSEGAGGNFIVTPRKQRDDAEYGFTLYPDGKMLLAVAFTTDENYMLQSEYTYKSKQTALNLDVTAGNKKYSGVFSYSEPEYNPSKPMARTEISSKWKRVSFKELFNSF